MQHQAKRAWSAEVAATSLRWAACAPHLPPASLAWHHSTVCGAGALTLLVLPCTGSTPRTRPRCRPGHPGPASPAECARRCALLSLRPTAACTAEVLLSFTAGARCASAGRRTCWALQRGVLRSSREAHWPSAVVMLCRHRRQPASEPDAQPCWKDTACRNGLHHLQIIHRSYDFSRATSRGTNFQASPGTHLSAAGEVARSGGTVHVIEPSASTLPARDDSGTKRLRACVLGCAKLPLLTRKPSQGTAKLHQE